MTALACTSHLLVDLPLFGGPVLLLVGAVVLMGRAERRRAAAEGEVAEPELSPRRGPAGPPVGGAAGAPAPGAAA